MHKYQKIYKMNSDKLESIINFQLVKNNISEIPIFFTPFNDVDNYATKSEAELLHNLAFTFSNSVLNFGGLESLYKTINYFILSNFADNHKKNIVLRRRLRFWQNFL